MKFISTAALALLTAAPAFAADIVLDFETPTSFASIAEFYNGGTDSAGAMGVAKGVSFGLDALTVRNDDGVGPYFANAPTPVGAMAPVGTDATMNVALGFINGISFYYASSQFVAEGVNVYTGLNGTGELLASFNLVKNAKSGTCGLDYCHFDRMTSTFEGVAHSVTFGKAAGLAGFDNIAITAVPEPTTALLLSLGVAGLFVARRRA